MKILVSNIMMLKDQERFGRLLADKGLEAVFPEVDQFMREDELLTVVGVYDGWLAGDDEITRAVLEKALPTLKVISKWGTGIDSIDRDAAKDLGVGLFNTPGAFRDAVSEVAIAYMLDLARRVTYSDYAIRNGEWPKGATDGLVGKTLGIVGFGAIGKGIAERAAGMKMTIKVSDPYYKVDSEFPNVENLDFKALVTQVDYLCLACNMSPENYHMINDEILASMRKGARIINVARGALIDETALISALKSGHLAGAGLDVFEIEPLPKTCELRKLDNIIFGSHNANNLVTATEFVHTNTLKNLYKGLNIN